MRVLLTGASVLVAVASGMPAGSDPGAAPGFAGEFDDDAAVVSGEAGRAAVPSGPGGSGGSGSGPRTVYLYLPACEGNDPNSPQRAAVGCAASLAMCAGTPAPDDVMFWRFRAVRAPDGSTTPWSTVGSVCLRAAQVPGPAGAAAFTLADFRRLPLPPATVHVQPAGGRTLVNVPTNLYASGRAETFDVTILGTPVRVRATPVRWTWTYGDGSTRTVDAPGAAYPDLSTAHTFTRAGRVRVRLTTTWTGSYSVDGGPAVPVAGTARVMSPPVTLTVVGTRSELVADARP